MTSELVPIRASVDDKIRYAKALAEAGLLPPAYRRQPGNVLLAAEYGEALGLHPIAAIQGLHVIDGKPTASASLISALVRRAGHRLRITGDDTTATAEITRADDPEFVYRSTWTLERADAAGLLAKPVWQSYPAAMLKARAITEAARDACQEALNGVQYTPEELGADTGESLPALQPATTTTAPDIIDAEPIEQPDQTNDEHAEPGQPGSGSATQTDVDQGDAGDVDEPRLMTQPQSRRLHAEFTRLGIKSHDGRLAAAIDVIDRPIRSSRELTTTEASRVIDALARLPHAQ